MKLLLLVNVPIPEAENLFNLENGNSGGWLIGITNFLSKIDDIDLTILFPMKGIKKCIKKKGDKAQYYSFPQFSNKNYDLNKTDKMFEEILQESDIDIVHIFGTELPHSLIMTNTCKKMGIKTVVSIQGIVSKIGEHFDSYLPSTVRNLGTFRNYIRKDRVIDLKKLYYNLAKNENEVLKKTDNVIGRTMFDEACTKQINNKLIYHFCNETLRESFYTDKNWEISKCERNTIFLSQGHYPIKGLHLMIEALKIIKISIPTIKVYIGGKNIIASATLKDRLMKTYYGKYIKRLIIEYNLQDNIIFKGPLNEKEIKQEYLNSNVFVCPSLIENSPNSLGEAMILGVPSIASFVGGTMDLMEHKVEGFLYQADAPYMLAFYVKRILENDKLANELSESSKNKAKDVYSKEVNGKRLLEIYNNITNSN